MDCDQNRSETASAQLRRWVSETSYKPDWIFQLDERDGVSLLRAIMPVRDSRRPGAKTVVTAVVELGQKARSSKVAFQDQVLALVEHLEKHEIREWLTFGGDRTFDPHKE
ncbi:hypothetical protein ACWDUL_20190 [Nocardia niigatensis]